MIEVLKMEKQYFLALEPFSFVTSDEYDGSDPYTGLPRGTDSPDLRSVMGMASTWSFAIMSPKCENSLKNVWCDTQTYLNVLIGRYFLDFFIGSSDYLRLHLTQVIWNSVIVDADTFFLNWSN